MKNLFTIVSFVIYGIFSMSFIQFMFPYSELAGLINYPMALIIAIVSSLLFILIKRILKSSISKWILLSSFFVINFLIMMLLIPQSRGSTFSQIDNYINTFKNYHNISCNKVDLENYAVRIATIHKCNCERNYSYYVFHYSNYKDSTESTVIIREDSLSNILNYNTANDTIRFNFWDKYNQKYINLRFTRENIESQVMTIKEDYFLNISEDKLKIDEGSESLFFQILNLSFGQCK